MRILFLQKILKCKNVNTIKDNVLLLLLISSLFFIREIIIDFYIVMYITFVTFFI